MADYYTQFSAAIDNITDEEKAWLEVALQTLDDLEWCRETFLDDKGELVDLATASAGADPKSDHLEQYRIFKDVHPYLADEESIYPNFEWNLASHSDGSGSIFLWLGCDECVNFDQVGLVVQAFLKKFRPDNFFTLTWAETCSKPRLDAFSGEGLFVTAKEVHTHVVQEWLD